MVDGTGAGRIIEDNEEHRTSCYYIIPAKLVENGNKTKALLYGLLTCLVNKDGYCCPTNRFLAQKMRLKSTSTISTYLKELEDTGWIRLEIVQNTCIRRRIYLILGKK